MKNLIVKFSGLLLTGYLFQWWLFDLSGLILSSHIPHTPINFQGLLIIVLLLAILIVLHKQIFKLDNSVSIGRLTIVGAIVSLISEIIFQLVRQINIEVYSFDDRIYNFFVAVFVMTLFGGVLSFFVAYQLKTKKTLRLIGIIFIFLIVLTFFRTILPITLS